MKITSTIELKVRNTINDINGIHSLLAYHKFNLDSYIKTNDCEINLYINSFNHLCVQINNKIYSKTLTKKEIKLIVKTFKINRVYKEYINNNKEFSTNF